MDLFLDQIIWILQRQSKKMYFAVGWPKLLQVVHRDSHLVHISANCDRMLFVVLTQSTIGIWFCKVSWLNWSCWYRGHSYNTYANVIFISPPTCCTHTCIHIICGWPHSLSMLCWCWKWEPGNGAVVDLLKFMAGQMNNIIIAPLELYSWKLIFLPH